MQSRQGDQCGCCWEECIILDEEKLGVASMEGWRGILYGRDSHVIPSWEGGTGWFALSVLPTLLCALPRQEATHSWAQYGFPSPGWPPAMQAVILG